MPVCILFLLQPVSFQVIIVLSLVCGSSSMLLDMYNTFILSIYPMGKIPTSGWFTLPSFTILDTFFNSSGFWVLLGLIPRLLGKYTEKGFVYLASFCNVFTLQRFALYTGLCVLKWREKSTFIAESITYELIKNYQ